MGSKYWVDVHFSLSERYFQIFSNIYKCLQIFLKDIFKYFQMYLDISKYWVDTRCALPLLRENFPNILKYFYMFPNIVEYF